MTDPRVTLHGFRFGPLDVSADYAFEWHPGRGSHVCVGLRTIANKQIQVYSSPKGRSVRIFVDNKEWGPKA